MSRTFDALERMQQDRELFEVPPVTKVPPAGVRSTRTGLINRVRTYQTLGFQWLSTIYETASSGKVSVPDLDVFADEEVLRLVRRLFLATDDSGRTVSRRVVFCGVDRADGSNLLCAKIGRCLASQVESPVCVVDTNVCPSADSLFDLGPPDSPAVSESGNTRNGLQRVAGNLWLLSSDGLADKGGVPPLEQVRAGIRDLGSEFIYVVISAPPAGLSSDAALLGQIADGVVLVLEANSTRRETAKRAKEALEAADVRVLGTVLNNRTFPIPEKIYLRI